MIRGRLWLAALLAVAAPAAAEPVIAIRATAVPVAQVQTAIPGLRVTGAWSLSSDDRRLGGMSGLLAADGELLMLSDAGSIVRLRDDFGGEANASIAALPSACMADGRIDAESLALSPDGLAVRVGLERSNCVCAFDLGEPDAGRRFSPIAIAAWPRNNGAEAMASLPGVGTAIIGEGRDGGSREHPLLWYAGDPANTAATAMQYRAPSGFKPADAAFLPDRRMLVLNRRFTMPNGRATVLTIGSALSPSAGAIYAGQEILRIEHGPLAANYEGLAVKPRPGGATIWLISDDNFSNRSGTMLIRLELDESATVSVAATGTIASPAR